MPNPVSGPKIKNRNLIQRWGGDQSVFAEGFLGVPTILLQRMSDIGEDGITPTEIVFLLQIMSFKWDEEDPYPSYRRIAEQMGISEPYARKIARHLEEKNLLIRRKREGTTNKFDLTPLFEALSEIGSEIEEERATSLPF
jgi:DNA-binding MarR family transcriptional regulator